MMQSHNGSSLLLAGMLALLGCGSKDSPQAPGGNNPPPGEVVLLDATRAASWTANVLTTGRDEFCSSTSQRSTDIASAWVGGTFIASAFIDGSPSSPNCCMGQRQEARIRSAAAYDLTPYASARVQCLVRITSSYYQGTEGAHRVTFTVHSNVPGTPDLNVFYSQGTPPYEQTVDLSLANVLGYQEASFELYFEVGGYCGGDPGSYIGGSITVEVLNFKIVGTRR